jgi:DNA primase
MGSNFCGELFGKLSRFTENFYVFLDGDESGRDAAAKTIDVIKGYLEPSRYLDIKLKFKNREYDPDEFLNKFGYEGFLKLLDKTKKDRDKQEQNADNKNRTVLSSNTSVRKSFA